MQGEVSGPKHDHAVPACLRAIAGFAARRPGMTLLATLVLCVASAVYTSSFLKFKTDRFDLIDPNAEYQQRWLNYAKTFDDQSDLVVAIEGKSPDAIEAAIDDLGQRMEAEPSVFANVLYKIDTRALRSKGLQYLTAAQLEE